MPDAQRYTRYAEKKAGTNNKFYEVEAIEEDGEIRYVFRWGRIGTKGQEKEHRAASFDYAKSVCDEQFVAKLRKGYREVTAMEALASAVEDVNERKTSGLPPIALEIPFFNAGKSEERCVQFARKWLDKLNLIRASYHDLDSQTYRAQLKALFEGYSKEWRRIATSRTHTLNICEESKEAAQAFFLLLRRNTGMAVIAFF